MELKRGMRRGQDIVYFKNKIIYLFYHSKSYGKLKDKEHLIYSFLFMSSYSSLQEHGSWLHD